MLVIDIDRIQVLIFKFSLIKKVKWNLYYKLEYLKLLITAQLHAIAIFMVI